MLIDDLRELNLRLIDYPVRESIAFRINESLNDFKRFQKRPSPYLPSLLPYDNLCLCFDDFILWFVQRFDRNGERQILSFDFPKEAPLLNIVSGQAGYCGTYAISPDLRVENYSIYFPLKQRFEFKEEYTETLEVHLLALYLFLSFLSCKNIKTELNGSPEKVQAKRRKRGKLPLVSYYTLKLQIPTKDSHGQAGAGAWTNRVHLCRGHMREYTAEAPLFGRLVGRYWIPPHVRGNKKDGLIVKDYEIEKDTEL